MSRMEKLELKNGDSINVYVCQDDCPRIIIRYGDKKGHEFLIGSLIADEFDEDGNKPDDIQINIYADTYDGEATYRAKINREDLREYLREYRRSDKIF